MNKNISVDLNSFGAHVKMMRLQHGYTQDKLAELCDVTINHIQNIELNRKRPSFELLVSIMEVLDLSFDRFVFHPEENNETSGLVDRIKQLPKQDIRFVHEVLNALNSRDGSTK